MRIARFRFNGKISYGIVLGEKVIPAEKLGIPETVEEFIASGIKVSPEGKEGIPLSKVELLAPLSNPPKIICLGLNYFDHAEEQGREPPKDPVIFLKPRTSIAGPFEDIPVPFDYTTQVDYEVELAVVIGRKGKRIPEEEAMNYVFGYMVFNDLSARDIQFGDKQWTRGKSLDKFAPMGPWITTRDEIRDPYSLRMRTLVNGEVMQDSSTAKMAIKIPRIISVLSKGMTLEPGDIIATGTPAGVGVFRNPQRFLKPGDIVEVEIENLGFLRNRIVAE
ncbi:MAG: FAA hydrolase family protein [Thermoproteota archaeon]|jgi:2-keto-4-pentenoate hydratase/2-oxohepta-3-ene-1,7-dioic acid hydratase in catechol pathway|uniref:FAA hydrolase family protein n=2 Tax=Candidatus Methanodesulfokora washburnensis TaxID=2478471 RepID=A0A3R9X518_9CREN|nr:FAA hydrolase family protein [Candidatus Methanodesulfokores washburnensis]TDA42005.1 MAG: FAA hydrolase family protein [Candidatus Korarchaeota archaeon]